MKCVNILVRVNCDQHFFVIYMLRQGQLYKDAMDLGILIVFINQGKKILFRDIIRLIILDFFKSQA